MGIDSWISLPLQHPTIRNKEEEEAGSKDKKKKNQMPRIKKQRPRIKSQRPTSNAQCRKGNQTIEESRRPKTPNRP